MSTKLFDLDEEVEGEILEYIAERPQPVYSYKYSDVSADYIIVSDEAIDPDDLESVAEELITQLDEDEDN